MGHRKETAVDKNCAQTKLATGKRLLKYRLQTLAPEKLAAEKLMSGKLAGEKIQPRKN